ncbi:MAG: heparan N-sulfatase, partial [Gammaproteobacteria bacterium]|nr:heparan N-sulfatase [Gammaproteobacteria bacterium]
WQLFNVIEDPDCLNDLSDSPQHASVFTEYQQQLTETLRATGDPRVLGYGQVWEDYPRIQGSMRYFPKPENEVDTE